MDMEAMVLDTDLMDTVISVRGLLMLNRKPRLMLLPTMVAMDTEGMEDTAAIVAMDFVAMVDMVMVDTVMDMGLDTMVDIAATDMDMAMVVGMVSMDKKLNCSRSSRLTTMLQCPNNFKLFENT